MDTNRGNAAVWPLAAVATLSLLWTPILGRGFVSDDFERVPTTWADVLDDPFRMDGRPVEMLTFALLPKHAGVHHAVSLLGYAACIGLMWLVCRRRTRDSWATFFALSSFFHPAFLWAVTWIAQRSTLLVIVFVLATMVATRVPSRLALIAAGSGVRTPYVVQNIVFAVQFFRERQIVASAISLLGVLVFGLAGYLTYYDRAAGIDTLANPAVSVVVSAPLRLIKLAEGVLYVFAPVPMFAVASWGPLLALAGYAACWITLARSLQPIRTADDLWVPATAGALCVPFVFASEVRVTGEAAVMTFLAVACAVEWRRSTKVAALGILLLNLVGIALNYGVFASRQHDIGGVPVVADSAVPIHAYHEWREVVRRQALGRLGLSVAGRN